MNWSPVTEIVQKLCEPPPPPPEEPEPEPEVEEPIEEQPVEEAMPDEPMDEAPAADLGVDGDASAGSDGFGLVARKGVADIERVRVDLEPALREQMRQRSGRNTVPQIWIDGRHVGGSDDLHELERSGTLDQLLAKAT